MTSVGQRRFTVRVGPSEIFDLVAALPDIQAGRYVLTGSADRFGLRPVVKATPYQTYAIVSTVLRGRVSDHHLGSEVAVRCSHRVLWRGVAVAAAAALPNFGGNLIADVIELPDSMRRLREQRDALIAVVAQALVPVQVAPGGAGPYRVW